MLSVIKYPAEKPMRLLHTSSSAFCLCDIWGAFENPMHICWKGETYGKEVVGRAG